MPLKLDSISRQIEHMTVSVTAPERRDRLAQARELLRRVDVVELRHKLSSRQVRIPWLLAIPTGSLGGTFAAPPPPADFTVAAADGSNIPPDRHSPARFYVLNTGWAVLTYGPVPDAALDSSGQLYFRDEDLYFDYGQKNIPIEGARLGIKMSVEELGALLTAARPAPRPCIALSDGSLILWKLQTEEAEVQRAFLSAFLARLDGFRDAGLPVASYVSRTGSNEVANTLRFWLCRGDPRDCAHCPLSEAERALCQLLGVLRDRELFAGLLGEGERSDVFDSESDVLKHYGDHRIQFFYLDVGGEIARVEAPQWVMRDAEMLGLVHALIHDQCRRSGNYPPYPPALQEAHEQAVITAGDRRVVEELVSQALADKGLVYTRSAKDGSKRRRGV